VRVFALSNCGPMSEAPEIDLSRSVSGFYSTPTTPQAAPRPGIGPEGKLALS